MTMQASMQLACIFCTGGGVQKTDSLPQRVTL